MGWESASPHGMMAAPLQAAFLSLLLLFALAPVALPLSVDPIPNFVSGETVDVSWQCAGASAVRLVLCQGQACGSGSASPPRAQTISPYRGCGGATSLSWSSPSALAGGAYFVCVEDYQDSSLRSCAAVGVAAAEVVVNPLRFVAGETASAHWRCTGTSAVRLALCKGQACAYSGASPSRVETLASCELCGAGGFSWRSSSGLGGGDDYLICAEDCSSPSVRGCAAANVTAASVAVSPVASVFAGDAVAVYWQCSGTSAVRVTLCRGQACGYYSAEKVQGIDSYETCDVGGMTWSSSSALPGGSDYLICAEDSAAAEVRGCAPVSIAAARVVLSPMVSFVAGSDVSVFWQCSGTSSVRLVLCKGQPCSYSVNSPQKVQTIDSYESCARGGISWSSPSSLVGGDYHFCAEDYNAPSVQGCIMVAITPAEVSLAAVEDFVAGDTVDISWQCSGTSSIRLVLCKGQACSHSVNSPARVLALSSQRSCSSGGFSWTSPVDLAAGSDYFLCAEDYSAPSVQGCTTAVIAAAQVVVQAVSFIAGNVVNVQWECSGTKEIKLVLCKVQPCSYSASSIHKVQTLDSRESCSNNGISWTSPSSLRAGDDYLVCAEAYLSSSVRGCAAARISAPGISITSVPRLFAGQSLQAEFQCSGTRRVSVVLCRQQPCSYSSTANRVAQMSSSVSCGSAFSWKSTTDLGGDYLLCAEDTSASWVQNCSGVVIAAAQISVSATPQSFFAGEAVGIQLQCSGPTHVRLVLCKEESCAYSGFSLHRVQTLHSYLSCANGYSWTSSAGLAGRADYLVCAEDYSASSIRGCAPVNVSAARIDVSSPRHFVAGNAVKVGWQCSGPRTINLVLCQGQRCTYSGSSEHRIAHLTYGAACDSSISWSSPSSLVGDSGYLLCAEDYSLSSVFACSPVTVLAAEIQVQHIGQLIAGEEIDITWLCSGTKSVDLVLCKGEPCGYSGSSPSRIAHVTYGASCDSSVSWSSSSGLAQGTDYLFCAQDHSAASVSGCTRANITAAKIDVTIVPRSFYAGEATSIQWQCSGTRNINLVLCKGKPCSYSGSSSSRIAQPTYAAACDSSTSWTSSSGLLAGDDYLFCAEDYSASSVRFCTPANITGAVISLSTISPFHAGTTTSISWQCHGTKVIKLTLCKGEPCSYSGSSQHRVQAISSYLECTQGSTTWTSSSGLAGGHDYMVCAEDYSASSVRFCTLANITGALISLSVTSSFYAGTGITISWHCFGTSAIKLALCKGEPCSYSGSSQHRVQTISSYSQCSQGSTTWTSSSGLAGGHDYLVCSEDYSASSVRFCAAVNITGAVISLSTTSPFHAGTATTISWECYGTKVIKLALCKGQPCSYSGSSQNRVQTISSYVKCTEGSTTWRSSSALVGGHDYLFCAEDYSASSVRFCAEANITGARISLSTISPFPAGKDTTISWQCHGTKDIRLALCKGQPCSYSGSSQHRIQAISSRVKCIQGSTTWMSSSALAQGHDYLLCAEDYVAPSVRFCTAANITGPVIELGAISPLHAGTSTTISWQCYGIREIRLTLCKGEPCSYSGSSQHRVQAISPRLQCAGSTTWTSSSALVGGHDYFICAEDYSASSVRFCTVANISSAVVSLSPLSHFVAGGTAIIRWQCQGTKEINLVLCKGEQCGYTAGNHRVRQISSRLRCSSSGGSSSFSWKSTSSLAAGDDYLICAEDYHASSVRSCTLANITAAWISLKPVPPFYADHAVTLHWECHGATYVDVLLCRGQPCSTFTRLHRRQSCESPGVPARWTELSGGPAQDYYFCARDSSAPGVSGCSAALVVARQDRIRFDEVAPFHAGESVELSWRCNGPSRVTVTLCSGGPCTSGSSVNRVAPVISGMSCGSPFVWPSANGLQSGDYHFCAQDADVSAVLACARASVAAGRIDVGPVGPFFPGESVTVEWRCSGPTLVNVHLCKGGACSHRSGSKRVVSQLKREASCDTYYAWSSDASLSVGDSYLFCVEDSEAPSVFACATVQVIGWTLAHESSYCEGAGWRRADGLGECKLACATSPYMSFVSQAQRCLCSEDCRVMGKNGSAVYTLPRETADPQVGETSGLYLMRRGLGAFLLGIFWL